MLSALHCSLPQNWDCPVTPGCTWCSWVSQRSPAAGVRIPSYNSGGTCSLENHPVVATATLGYASCMCCSLARPTACSCSQVSDRFHPGRFIGLLFGGFFYIVFSYLFH